MVKALVITSHNDEHDKIRETATTFKTIAEGRDDLITIDQLAEMDKAEKKGKQLKMAL